MDSIFENAKKIVELMETIPATERDVTIKIATEMLQFLSPEQPYPYADAALKQQAAQEIAGTMRC